MQPPESLTTRRAVAAGLAWSIPVVTVVSTAPAFALSPCVNRTIDWDTFATGSSPRSVTYTTGPVTETVNWSIVYGPGTSAGSLSGTVQDGPKGAINQKWFRLGMGTNADPVATTDRIDMTFTFPTPVTNLNLRIMDIDRIAGSFSDWVNITPGFTETFRGTNVNAGTGLSEADAWRSTNSADVTPTQNTGSVAVNYAGPISSVTITYKSGPNSSGAVNTHIGLADLTFCL